MSSAIKPQPKILANRVTSTPGVCGGKPCIAGHRIRIIDIYVLHGLQGLTPEKILETYPSLTTEDVEAGISYYQNHRNEVSQSYIDEGARADEWRRILGPGPLEEKRLRMKKS